MRLALTSYLVVRHLLPSQATTSQLPENPTSENSISQPTPAFPFPLSNEEVIPFSNFIKETEVYKAIQSYLRKSDLDASLKSAHIECDHPYNRFSRDPELQAQLTRIHEVVGLMMFRAAHDWKFKGTQDDKPGPHLIATSSPYVSCSDTLRTWNNLVKAGNVHVSLDEVDFKLFTPEEISAILNVCKRITSVSLAHSTSLTSEFISVLNLHHVKKLDCSWCDLESLPIPAKCPVLDRLNLSDNCIQPEYPSTKLRLRQVTRVYLAGNSKVKKTNMKGLMKIYPSAMIEIS